MVVHRLWYVACDTAPMQDVSSDSRNSGSVETLALSVGTNPGILQTGCVVELVTERSVKWVRTWHENGITTRYPCSLNTSFVRTSVCNRGHAVTVVLHRVNDEARSEWLRVRPVLG